MANKLESNKVDICIYHNNCFDGFTSACIVKLKNPECELFGASHSTKKYPDVTGKHVVICDFSYSKEIILFMIEKAKSFLILDHHKTAEKILHDIDEDYKVFNMDKSGATLTWEFFFPDKEIPNFVKYVEDRDLWKFELPNSKQFSSAIKTVKMTIENYTELFDNDKHTQLLEKGKIIYKYEQDYIEWVSSNADVKLYKLCNGKYYLIASVNSPTLKSELGNYLVEKYLNADFSLVYNYDEVHNKTHISLRSLDSRTDVSSIAKMYGGGGHRNASGVCMDGLVSGLEKPIILSSMKNIMDDVDVDTIKCDDKEYSFVKFNTNFHKYQLGRYLLDKYEDANFSVMYTFNSNKTKFTLIFRSEDRNIKKSIKKKFKADEYWDMLMFERFTLTTDISE